MLPRLLTIAAACVAVPAVAAEFVAPYVTTPREDVELMLELAAVGPGDYVIDLGSGDGRIVIDAALRGAMGHGIELDRQLVARARQRARTAEVSERTLFRHGDIFDADLGAASVVTLYLMQDVNLRLRPKLLAELAPGTRVLSNSFHMGQWQPDQQAQGRSSGGIMLWIIPADVAGEWTVSVDEEQFRLAAEQRFQEIDLNLRRRDEPLHVLGSVLRGDRITFTAGDGRNRYAFNGRVNGERMQGFVQVHAADGSELKRWRAVRR